MSDRNKASVGNWGKVIQQCLPGDQIHYPGVDERNIGSTPFAALEAAEAKRQRKLERNRRLTNAS